MDGAKHGASRTGFSLGLLVLLGGALACGDPGRGAGRRPEGAVAVRGACSFDAATPRPDGGPPELDAGAPSVRILAPADAASWPRDDVDGARWVARGSVEVEASGVSTLELVVDGEARSSMTAPGGVARFELSLERDGEREITVRGLDDLGLERARDRVGVRVTPPDDGSCHAMLDALGLDWEPASPSPGITDPVRVQPTIGGVRYRYVSRVEPTAMVMDCELAPRLHRLSGLVREHGVDEVIHIGIYNYRCIGGGDPDSGECTPSQHAYARAIDIWGLGVEGSDEEYVLERDWVITEETCPGAPVDEADRVLHEVGCAMWERGIFQIVLTPNYNAAHRNHFHVDMTDGSMFIGYSVAGVDPDVPHLGH